MKNYDKTRQYLRSKGWNRRDRTNQKVTSELWEHERTRGRLISYEAAMQNQKKWDLKTAEVCNG